MHFTLVVSQNPFLLQDVVVGCQPNTTACGHKHQKQSLKVSFRLNPGIRCGFLGALDVVSRVGSRYAADKSATVQFWQGRIVKSGSFRLGP